MSVARHEVVGFALAGVCAYAVDLALFVGLRSGLHWDPIAAKSLSFVAGCTVAYLGNAFGTYRGRRAGPREYAVFFAVNIAGALVQLLCIAVSHYGLGFTSPRADTLSGAVVGMALATCLRFWGTRTLVFGRGPRGPRPDRHSRAGEGSRTSWTG
ncbi:GtrA family protein [Streptomyces sp. ASQP_92]|uniref:GtrA family protein n=1 Tax=Streptomyces sp. ASQP_92 TaxID=2979116 RepID=UPI0021C1E440|nr:GtrA family protein [Streptomyces sp. ASQP_92]MCT9089419.1 GtrA family protein [Streptomyces sp. ASQP_92]